MSNVVKVFYHLDTLLAQLGYLTVQSMITVNFNIFCHFNYFRCTVVLSVLFSTMGNISITIMQKIIGL